MRKQMAALDRPPSRHELNASVQRLAAFLARNLEECIFRYTFGYSYPTNCCQGASLILLFLIEEKYPSLEVTMIKGTDPKTSTHHYWVLVHDWIYDLTAHQFEGHEQVIGTLYEPLHEIFSEWQLEKDREFVSRDEVIALYREGVIPF